MSDLVRVVGPLQPYAQGFDEELKRRGYTSLSAVNQLRVLAHLSRWLREQGLDPAGLTDDGVDAYLRARRDLGYTCWLSRRGVAPMLAYLRGLGVLPAAVAPIRCGPVEELLADYRAYLLGERGLAGSTARHYEADVRRFLSRRADADLAGLTAGDVSRLVVGECAVRSRGSARMLVTTLRSFLRFVFVTGRLDCDLAAAVPSVAGWRDAGLPRALEPEQVRALLAGCDRGRAVGRRDFAILTVLVRLGLRAGEVAAMELADIDWRAGEIVVRGKGNQADRLPLPVDVGQALVGYLCRSRPPVAHPRVFLRARAPYGPLTSTAVQTVVRTACGRAGIETVGAHRLRHTAATAALRAGASMQEVAQLLRHRHLASTTIYAKVDRAALQAVARRWPGGVS
jgi:integrase/recombinase XerD